MQRIVFLDTETTGLTETDQVIQVAAIQWTGPGQVVQLFNRYFMPTVPCDPRAAAVNGFTPEEWAKRGARQYTIRDAGEIAAALDGAILAGSNPNFDRRMLTQMARLMGVEPPRWSHRSIDTASLAFPLLYHGKISQTGLEHVAEYFGIRRIDPHHDALVDCVMAMRVIERLLDLYSPGIVG